MKEREREREKWKEIGIRVCGQNCDKLRSRSPLLLHCGSSLDSGLFRNSRKKKSLKSHGLNLKGRSNTTRERSRGVPVLGEDEWKKKCPNRWSKIWGESMANFVWFSSFEGFHLDGYLENWNKINIVSKYFLLLEHRFKSSNISLLELKHIKLGETKWRRPFLTKRAFRGNPSCS